MNYKQEQIKPDDLNHPCTIYPNSIMSEYHNYKLYREEYIRFLNFMTMFNEQIETCTYLDSRLLVSIILGSTMEDAIVNSHTSYTNFFQSQQLFPNYIDNFIENIHGQKHIQIIIISPDNFFNNDTYIPLFIKYSQYEFVKKNLYSFEYVDMNNDITIRINIFNCPMASIENRKETIFNSNKIFNMNTKDCIVKAYNIETFEQNSFDLIFIKRLYDQIEKLFKSNDINKTNIIINSWVNFKNLYGYSENYKMFPKLLELASEYNIIATEWAYQDEIFITKIISSYHFGNKNYTNRYISYIRENIEYFDDDIIEKNLKLIKNKLLLTINFNMEHLLGII